MARPTLSKHRKFRRLARVLSSTIVARGVLELLWDQAYESGDDYVGTASDLEATVEWNGESGALTKALVEAGLPEGHGFIERVEAPNGTDEPCYRIHDLFHHAPEYVRKRCKRELTRRARSSPTADVRQTAPDGGQCLPFGGQWPPSRDSQTEVDVTPAPAPAPARAPAPAPAPAPALSTAETSSARETPKRPSRRRSNGDGGERFDLFWRAYPKRVARGAALKAWQKLRPDAGLVEQILAALRWQAQQDDWLRDGGRFVPNPASWLNAARWQDEPSHTPRLSARTLAIGRAAQEFLGS